MEREQPIDRAEEEEPKDTELERRAGPDVMRDVEPFPPRERGTAIYGETDVDPNREDQQSAHHAEADEHL